MMEPSLTYSLILFCCCSLRRYAGRLISVNCCFTMEISNQTRAALTAEESLKFSDRFWTGFGGNRDRMGHQRWLLLNVMVNQNWPSEERSGRGPSMSQHDLILRTQHSRNCAKCCAAALQGTCRRVMGDERGREAEA